MLSFFREMDGDQVLAVFNLSPTEVTVSLAEHPLVASGPDALRGDAVDLTAPLTLPPWGYRVVTPARPEVAGRRRKQSMVPAPGARDHGRRTRTREVRGVPLIDVDSLTREFSVTERESGLGGALRSVVRRHTKSVTAVRDVSFTVEGGTVLGLLGPNGSGKTTTLKCVAGLLTPTAGSVTVLGLTPSERPPELLRRLGFVMGQRWQLHPDIPVLESFELHRVIYDLDRDEFARTLCCSPLSCRWPSSAPCPRRSCSVTWTCAGSPPPWWSPRPPSG